MASDEVMLIKTRGSSYLLSPDEPHFYAVVWVPRDQETRPVEVECPLPQTSRC